MRERELYRETVMSTKTWALDPDPKGLDDYDWCDEQLSERKRYLFVVAVGREIIPLMTLRTNVRSVEAAEKFAEGLIDQRAFGGVIDEARLPCDQSAAAIGVTADWFVRVLCDSDKHDECVNSALEVLGYVEAVKAGVMSPLTSVREQGSFRTHPSFLEGRRAGNRKFARYLLDIFGTNPHDPVKFDPRWRSNDAVCVAPPSTRRGTTPRCRRWPTPSKTPAVTRPPSSTIAVTPRGRTSAAVG